MELQAIIVFRTVPAGAAAALSAAASRVATAAVAGEWVDDRRLRLSFALKADFRNLGIEALLELLRAAAGADAELITVHSTLRCAPAPAPDREDTPTATEMVAPVAPKPPPAQARPPPPRPAAPTPTPSGTVLLDARAVLPPPDADDEDTSTVILDKLPPLPPRKPGAPAPGPVVLAPRPAAPRAPTPPAPISNVSSRTYVAPAPPPPSPALRAYAPPPAVSVKAPVPAAGSGPEPAASPLSRGPTPSELAVGVVPGEGATMVTLRKVAAAAAATGQGLTVAVQSVAPGEIRAFLPLTGKSVTVRTSAPWDVVEGEVLIFKPGRIWRFARSAIADGEFVRSKLDVEALRLPPLKLVERGPYGRELERPTLGEDSDAEGPLAFAREAIRGRLTAQARPLLRSALLEDLRCLEAHDLLSSAAVQEENFALAARHDAVLLAIALAAVPADFHAQLPRHLPGNAPLWSALDRWAHVSDAEGAGERLWPVLARWRAIVGG